MRLMELKRRNVSGEVARGRGSWSSRRIGRRRRIMPRQRGIRRRVGFYLNRDWGNIHPGDVSLGIDRGRSALAMIIRVSDHAGMLSGRDARV